MKVLVHNRDPQLWVGGDAIQVKNTIKALRTLGLSVDFTANSFTDVSQYDLVHVFHVNFFWTTPLMQACIDQGIPYILSAIYFDREIDNNFATMKQLIFKAKKVIALSVREKQEIIKRFQCDPRHVLVIPNGVDKTIFYESNPNFGTQSNRSGVISVGRLSDRAKGADLVINACYKAGIPLTYIGQSDESSFNWDLKKKCHHLERVSQRELAKIYNQHKVYVCSSLSERQSLGVLEAKACGCNIVDSIFNRGNDLLPSSIVVDPRDENSLIKAINQQLKSFYQPDFVPSWLDIAKKIAEIYEQSIKK